MSLLYIQQRHIQNPFKCQNSRLEVFCRKYVLRNFAKFTGKHLCQSLFFNKVAGLRQPLQRNQMSRIK